MRTPFRLLAFAWSGLAGCEAEAPADSAGSTDSATDTSPRIRIVSPAANAELQGCVDLEVSVQNFTLVDHEQQTANVDGEGHYHTILADDTYVVCIETACTIELPSDLPPTGDILVQLMNHDHTPVTDDAGAPITDQVTVQVAPGECAG